MQNRVKKSIYIANTILRESAHLEFADRPLEYDSDVSGVPGMRPIFDTIKRKIEECAVFIADLTPILDGDRYYPNPNVMLELGYAMAVKRSEQIILLTGLNGMSELKSENWPFDIRHYSNPMVVECCSKIEKSKVDAHLSCAIVASLKYYEERLTPHFNTQLSIDDPIDIFSNLQIDTMLGVGLPSHTKFQSSAYLFTHIWPNRHTKELGVGVIKRSIVDNQSHIFRDFKITTFKDWVIIYNGNSNQHGTIVVDEAILINRSGECLVFKSGNVTSISMFRHMLISIETSTLIRDLFTDDLKFQSGIKGYDRGYIRFSNRERDSFWGWGFQGDWRTEATTITSRALSVHSHLDFLTTSCDILEGCGNDLKLDSTFMNVAEEFERYIAGELEDRWARDTA